MKLKEATVATVTYHSKSKDEITERDVIVFSVPRNVVRTLDVNDFTKDKKEHLRSLVEEYLVFKKQHLSQLPNFEEWVLHTKNEEIKCEWRALTPERITNIK